MKRLSIFCSLLLFGLPILTAQASVIKTNTTDSLSTTQATPTATSAQPKTSTEKLEAIPITYIYKLKNRKLKQKFWYNPSQNVQPVDYYIAQGWEVVKIKKMNAPHLIENLITWGKVILPMVEPLYNKTVKKE